MIPISGNDVSKNLRMTGKRSFHDKMELITCLPGSKKEEEYDLYLIACHSEERDELEELVEEKRYQVMNERRELKYRSNDGYHFLREASEVETVGAAVAEELKDEYESK